MHQTIEVLVKEPHEVPVVEAHMVQEEEVIEELGKDKVQESLIEEKHNPKEVMPLTDQV